MYALWQQTDKRADRQTDEQRQRIKPQARNIATALC